MNEGTNKRMNPFYFLLISSDDALSVSSGAAVFTGALSLLLPAKPQPIRDSSARGRSGHSGRLIEKSSDAKGSLIWALACCLSTGRRWQEVLKSPESHALRYLAPPPLRDLDVGAVSRSRNDLGWRGAMTAAGLVGVKTVCCRFWTADDWNFQNFQNFPSPFL